MKGYITRPGRSSYKIGPLTNIRNEIFAIGFGTRVIATEINKEKQVVQMRNKPIARFVVLHYY
jgi:hypothetical protein